MARPRASRCACAILAALIACPAAAQSVSGEASLVSDYRFRGVSLSGGHPAAQASLTLEHDSGFYGNLWGSTLGHGSQTEVDLGECVVQQVHVAGWAPLHRPWGARVLQLVEDAELHDGFSLGRWG